MRSRTSAAYVVCTFSSNTMGQKDFFWKARMVDLDRTNGRSTSTTSSRGNGARTRAPAKIFNAIVNKTAISYKANRKIGGKAPSEYLDIRDLEDPEQVKLADAGMDDILRTHVIDPALLRGDDFDAFYRSRKAALLNIVVQAMGKPVAQVGEVVPEDEEEEDADAQ